ncbi:MFS general substrate transporter [Hyaloscypha variabilis F]|uniref:MFS general substrate transporter n=1 Tax=Hyaloscypha variabilis (strain UAMH 11265 / GT02V1 / F) TaxID=1149755 RepID=A0A2J6RR81_HYAVF|nr:MFS general substrate transporter [Hyaloscypha variabilis F]
MTDATDQNTHLDEKGTYVAGDTALGEPLPIESSSEEKESGVVKSQSAGQQPSDVIQGQDDPPAEPPSEQEVQRVQSAGEDYSVLTVTQKRLIVATASLASLFSPMATAIYYPSLDTISKDLNVSNTKINITITLFLVIQGIAPAFVADIADRQGRRPMYIFCFTVFTGANIGLALQNNYTALLVLRMLQSSGSSGTVALANGVVGDIITSAERGSYVAFASLGGVFGPMISPILGGIIGQYAGWHWIFWFLLIFSSAVFIPLILFMPETCRNVVDNGSIPPPLFSRNITDTVRHRHRVQKGLTFNEAKQKEMAAKYHFRLPNPLSTLKVLLDLESAILLVGTGLGIGCFYAISTGASVAFASNYGFNQIKIGLMFIPIGCGSIISALSIGRLADWNYRRWAKKLNILVVKNRRQDLTNFPIERARLEIVFPLFFVAVAAIIAYGWILTKKISVAVPIVLLFLTGFSLTATFQILNVLMVDIYPGKPSVATAANNFSRCEIGAVFSAILLPLVDSIGWGWAYTLLALLFLAFLPMLLLVMQRGPKWRKQRKASEDKARAHRQEKRDLKTAAKERKANGGT